MKTLFTLACTVLFLSALNARPELEPNKNKSASIHLSEVNKQWLKHVSTAPAENISFITDVDRIQYHLLNVESYLRSHTPAGLSAEAMQNRPRLLDELHAYAEEKKFPTNTQHSERTPYFIDDYNVYCAVGYLISVSGHDALARRINMEHRYNYIHDIVTNGLVDWAKEYGFTVDELAWIQPTYSPTTMLAPLQAGTDGPVNNLFPDYMSNTIVFAGAFNYVNSTPCMNIGRYNGSQLECFGDGIPGTINDVLMMNEGLLAVGDLGSTGMNAPLAKFNITTSTWEYEQIPQIPGAVGHVVFHGGMDYTKEIVVSQLSSPNQHEIWYKMETGAWVKQATVNGVINDIEASSLGRVYSGAFSSIIVHKPTGDEMVLAHNVVINDAWNGVWFGIANDVNEVSEEVLVVKNIGDALYIGGTTSGTTSDVCLTRYLNGTLQPLILKNMFSDTTAVSIRDIQLYENSSLIIGGDFDMNNMMWWGKNLALFDLVNNYIMPIAVLNDGVAGLGERQGEWCLGGNFTTDEVSGQTLSHLARIDDADFIDDLDAKNDLHIYPNPASDALIVTANNIADMTSLKVFDVLGRAMINVEMNDATLPYQLDVSKLNDGLYMLMLESASGKSVRNFQVNR